MLHLSAVAGVWGPIGSPSPSGSLSMIVAFVLLVAVQILTAQVSFENGPWCNPGYGSRMIFDHAVDIQTVFGPDMTTDRFGPLLGTAVSVMGLYGVASAIMAAWILRYRRIRDVVPRIGGRCMPGATVLTRM